MSFKRIQIYGILAIVLLGSLTNVSGEVDGTRPIMNEFSTLRNTPFKVIFPSSSDDKPLECQPAMKVDWLSTAYFTTKLSDYSEYLDNDPLVVDQNTGQVFDATTSILTMGGPLVNPVTKQYESRGIAPLKVSVVHDQFQFEHRDGFPIPGSELSVTELEQNDVFIIEFIKDSGQDAIVSYGFGWRGTYAAGKYWDAVIIPNLDSYQGSWIMVKWTDSNNNGFVEAPNMGDYYTVLRREDSIWYQEPQMIDNPFNSWYLKGHTEPVPHGDYYQVLDRIRSAYLAGDPVLAEYYVSSVANKNNGTVFVFTSSLEGSVLSYIRELADAPEDVDVRFLPSLASRRELDEWLDIVGTLDTLDLLHDLVGLNMVGISINGMILLGVEDFDEGSLVIVKDVLREKVPWGILCLHESGPISLD